jgi:periplasmic divalent cation tolerance protein
MQFNYCMIYITTKDMEEAEMISKIILEKRLAACSNIIPGMKSFYHWKGNMETEAEVVLLFKTKLELFDDIVAIVKKNHSYEIPCIIAYPIVLGSLEYLHWIEEETSRK